MFADDMRSYLDEAREQYVNGLGSKITMVDEVRLALAGSSMPGSPYRYEDDPRDEGHRAR